MGVKELKCEMIKSPELIIELLEHYNFAHIELRPKEIRFARNEDGGKNIAIRLDNNEYLGVSDFVKTTKLDIFSYIMTEKGVDFKDVITNVHKIFNLDEHSIPKQKKTFFAMDMINDLKSSTNPENCDPKFYSETELDTYRQVANMRFYRDHISIETQYKFGLLYNVATQRIGIPIRDDKWHLCGIKSRRNYETDNKDDPKYIYELPCEKSLILYGFCENYEWLNAANKIYIGESEKFVMQCDSYGYHNAVALMGNSISPKQCSMLLALQADEYCFMFDEGLEIETIQKNIETLKAFAKKSGNKEIKVTWFDYRNSGILNEKDSATDHGKKVWEYIINHDIKDGDKIEINKEREEIDCEI